MIGDQRRIVNNCRPLVSRNQTGSETNIYIGISENFVFAQLTMRRLRKRDEFSKTAPAPT